MSQDLPGSLAEPLHILEPAAESSVLPWLLALALVAALLAWWIRHRARRQAPAAPDVVVRVSKEGRGIVGRIRRLRQKYLHRYDRREGCHELAMVLRDHLETRVDAMVATAGRADSAAWRRRPPLSVLTAREIAALLGDGSLARFLVRLAGHQFGRIEPDQRTFVELCDLAEEAVKRTPGGPT